MAVGHILRQRRQEEGVSLDALSARTNIPVRILSAIERDDFEAVPAGIFARGYLRACARQLHLDADALLARFSEEQAGASLEGAPPASPDFEPTRLLAHSGTVVTMLVTAAVAAVTWYGWWAAAPRVDAGATATVRASTPATEDVAGRLVGTSGAPTTAAPVDVAPSAPRPAPLTMTLEASRRVWIAADADGRRAAYRLLAAGEQLQLMAQHTVRVRAGDAGAVRYRLSGGEWTPLGRPGEVRSAVFAQRGSEVTVR